MILYSFKKFCLFFFLEFFLSKVTVFYFLLINLQTFHHCLNKTATSFQGVLLKSNANEDRNAASEEKMTLCFALTWQL